MEADGVARRSGSGGAFFVTFFAKTLGAGETGGDCGVSFGEIAGMSTGDLGTGVALSGAVSFRSSVADDKGMAGTGPSLSGVLRGVGTGGAARRSGGVFLSTFFAKTLGTEETSGGCRVSFGEIVGASASDSGTDGGGALKGAASFRSLAADSKGVAGAGPSLAGASRGVGTRGVA